MSIKQEVVEVELDSVEQKQIISDILLVGESRNIEPLKFIFAALQAAQLICESQGYEFKSIFLSVQEPDDDKLH